MKKRWISLFVENEILIGRDASVCQLVYPSGDRTISSVHCKVQCVNGMVQITDMGSTNGTFLDTGARLAPHTPQTMQSGQGFYLGDKSNSFAIRVQEDVREEVLAEQATPQKGGKGFSITSMVLGIVSICLAFSVFLGLACGIVGLVFGAFALCTRKNGRGMALAGFICSIVGISIPLLTIILGLLQII